MGIWTTNAAAGGVLMAAFMTYIHDLGDWLQRASTPHPDSSNLLIGNPFRGLSRLHVEDGI